MRFEDFENIVKDSLKQLPKEFLDILTQNQITVTAREEAPEAVKEKYKGSIVFGIFIGAPYGRFVNIQLEPTRIELYQDSFEKVYSGENEIKAQILKTVIHEIAHYFGFSEQKIRQMGY
jgi:predicted Zn-dependent protease with MMP-like domain